MTAHLDFLIRHAVLPLLWLAWAFYWWLGARDVKETTRRESTISRLLHVIPMMLAGVLLWMPRLPVLGLDHRFLAWTPWNGLAGTTIAAGGFAFMVWARRHIGRNWSAVVTLKQDHELVTSGPYALVRHPIYTGLLLAFIGSAIALGHCRGLLAVLVMCLTVLRKYRLEERWLRECFGVAYDAYRAREGARAFCPLTLHPSGCPPRSTPICSPSCWSSRSSRGASTRASAA